jgi:GTP diphosphokinase / guanosine-3',5'-bis(diphosphate) 3'-diphosphatase
MDRVRHGQGLLRMGVTYPFRSSHVKESPAMPTHMELVLQAAAFAAEKHRNGRRKDAEASPYINHPIQLAYILVQADIEDPIVLASALLHDTIEDTNTTHDEIEIVFGHEIANIVVECSDDKALTKLERKQAQVDKAAKISQKAKLVKIADKIANVSDIDGAPPAGWSLERKREYYDWAKRVVDQMRGVHAKLEARFDAEYAKRP